MVANYDSNLKPTHDHDNCQEIIDKLQSRIKTLEEALGKIGVIITNPDTFIYSNEEQRADIKGIINQALSAQDNK